MSRLNIRTGEKRFPVAPDLYGNVPPFSDASAESIHYREFVKKKSSPSIISILFCGYLKNFCLR